MKWTKDPPLVPEAIHLRRYLRHRLPLSFSSRLARQTEHDTIQKYGWSNCCRRSLFRVLFFGGSVFARRESRHLYHIEQMCLLFRVCLLPRFYVIFFLRLFFFHPIFHNGFGFFFCFFLSVDMSALLTSSPSFFGVSLFLYSSFPSFFTSRRKPYQQIIGKTLKTNVLSLCRLCLIPLYTHFSVFLRFFLVPSPSPSFFLNCQ